MPTATLTGRRGSGFKREVSKQTRTIVITVAATLLTVVILQNFRDVAVQFIVWRFSMPLTVVVLLAGLAGAFIGWFWRRR